MKSLYHRIDVTVEGSTQYTIGKCYWKRYIDDFKNWQLCYDGHFSGKIRYRVKYNAAACEADERLRRTIGFIDVPGQNSLQKTFHSQLKNATIQLRIQMEKLLAERTINSI